MTKLCGLCQKQLKTDDIVIALLLAKFADRGDSYDIEVTAQTIISHFDCSKYNNVEEKPCTLPTNPEK